MAAQAGGDEEAANGRLVEDRHPVGCDVEGAGVSPAVAGVGEPRHGAPRALEDRARLFEARFAAEKVGVHRMLGLVVGERAREREVPGLGAHIASPGEVQIDEVGPAERRIALHDEDGMAADHDRELHAREPRDAGRPEPRGVHDDGRVDALAARGRDAGDAAARLVDRNHLGALFDDRAPAAGRVGVAQRDRGRITVARLRLVEHRAEPFRVDPRLHPGDVFRLEELCADAERPLDPKRRLELRAHGRGDADQRPAADVPRLAADRLTESLEDAERAQDHRARLGRRVELADDADRVPGAPGGEEAALQHEHSPHAEPGQVEGERGAGDAPADDDDVGGGRHVRPAATTAAASPAPTRWMRSP